MLTFMVERLECFNKKLFLKAQNWNYFTFWKCRKSKMQVFEYFQRKNWPGKLGLKMRKIQNSSNIWYFRNSHKISQLWNRYVFESIELIFIRFHRIFRFWRSEVRRLVNGVCRRVRRIPHFCDEIRSSEKQEVELSCVLAAIWVRHVWRTMKLHMSATNNNNILGKFEFS